MFLRNKNKSVYYLVSMPIEKRADLKLIQKRLNENKLSFGSEDALFEKLNITTGAVSALNIIGVEKTDVVFAMDKVALECEKVGFHPNVNTATILFEPAGIEKIMDRFGADLRFVDLNEEFRKI